jgi:hypothetical protein
MNDLPLSHTLQQLENYSLCTQAIDSEVNYESLDI